MLENQLAGEMKKLKQIIQAQDDFFYSNITLDVNFRIKKLKELKLAIKKYEAELITAFRKDLGKGKFEVISSEIGLVQNELTQHIKHLKRWARPKRAGTPLYAFPSKSFVYKQPLGRILIISPFNYPFMLTIAPLVGALSAGNVAVLKPSEAVTNVTDIIEKIISEVFDREYVSVVKGDALKSQKLLSYQWDKIFFTGSSRVGKIVLQAAATHITPVVLELGGKNPVIVDKDANLKIAARRIIWGKLLNGGQSCVAPDYLFVHESVKNKFLELMVASIKAMYPGSPMENRDFTRIVSSSAVRRVSELLKGSTVYYGGDYDEKTNYFSPTILTDVLPDSPVMRDEIFGPVLPVLSFHCLDEVFSFLRRGEKPLATYYFSESRKKQKEFLKRTASGDAMINDVVIHFTNLSLPFGGVGNSGMGSYHGKRSFDVFSHERSVMKTSSKIDLPLRYPPYKKWVFKVLRLLFK
ncbi:aldehyde dehydrogenase family protein [Maribellus comscasis]|uniref:Aldehyde dehydrogenase n=1 Tax=Maribellus comscasis TaxID=2681766 RepID=A0A6I6JYY4_9BACT|nr:aldehyde dehydrogenase [Maribellus comscasis]QGY44353.1 aldehyde dehydrogenase family protein [Maribellus comscasis]